MLAALTRLSIRLYQNLSQFQDTSDNVIDVSELFEIEIETADDVDMHEAHALTLKHD